MVMAQANTVEPWLLEVPGTYDPSSSHPNFEAPESGFLNVYVFLCCLKYKMKK